jgi:hypothetical protein
MLGVNVVGRPHFLHLESFGDDLCRVAFLVKSEQRSPNPGLGESGFSACSVADNRTSRMIGVRELLKTIISVERTGAIEGSWQSINAGIDPVDIDLGVLDRGSLRERHGVDRELNGDGG